MLIYKLIEQFYFFDYEEKLGYEDLEEKIKTFYLNKLMKIFNDSLENIGEYFKYFMEKFNSNLNILNYKDEYHKITIIFENCVLRVSHQSEQYYLFKYLMEHNVDNLEEILDIKVNLESNTFCYVSKKYNIINDKSIVDYNVKKFQYDIINALKNLEKIGYYH